jgi:hypothetical protein
LFDGKFYKVHMKNSFGFTCYLAGLSMLGYLAMDMYLPAFGTIAQNTCRCRPGRWAPA